MIDFSLLKYVRKLNKLVGSVIIFTLLESKPKAQDEISDHGEISARNNIMKRAWHFLLDNLEYGNSLMLFREYNKIVGELLFSYAGEIRTIPVQIGGTSWEPEMPHTGILIATIDELEKISDIELKALKYFCFVTRAQMFIDGNKRVAQLIANKILIENNIGIFQIPIEKLEEFKTLLIAFYESDDDSDIICFMKTFCIKRVR